MARVPDEVAVVARGVLNCVVVPAPVRRGEADCPLEGSHVVVPDGARIRGTLSPQLRFCGGHDADCRRILLDLETVRMPAGLDQQVDELTVARIGRALRFENREVRSTDRSDA